ncbi:MAG: ChaN family lipoprotein [Planctomycetes bacterium]|nr:ChaN family lipoprotein [Planctomycetota bacterium]
MVRNLSVALGGFLLLTTCAGLCVDAQEREKDHKEVHTSLAAEYTVERAGYSRELWVGIPGAGLGMGEVTADDLRKALGKACDDTTSVAVIEPKLDEGTTEERETLAVVASRRALAGAFADVNSAMDGAVESDTRVVLVGVMDTCGIALRIANDKSSRVAGVVLIDPAVEDLPEIEAERMVGVDVLLHPRSDAEFERETETIVDRLGSWGLSARVLRGHSTFDNLKERVADAYQQLRGYQLIHEEPKPASAFELAGQLSAYNVVFVGELHGNPGAHRVELEVLRRMAKDGGPLALATEQFERDTQQVLDDYLAGKISEKEFREKGHLWPNYADYRPLVEFCKANKIPVIAGNIPRPLANRVYKEGVDVLEKFTDEEKSWSASEVKALPGAYRTKFFEAMGGMEGHTDAMERMYASQCFKDDTMADSVAKWLKENPKGRVLHINGNFHSKGGLGVPEKLEALVPTVKIAMVTCVQPGEDEEAAAEEWLVRVPGMRQTRQSAASSGR